MRAKFLPPNDPTQRGSSRVIVSAAIGEHYQKDFAVTVKSCNAHCPDAWRLYYSDYPDGCPPQEKQQYAFKIYAMQEAIDAGFRHILWMDSSLSPIAPITSLWRTIAAEGWYAPPQFNGITTATPWRHWASTKQATLAEWCSDAALVLFGITRDVARSIPLVMTGLVGLDMQSEIAERIWGMHRYYFERGAFNGPHENRPGKPMVAVGRKFAGHVSSDPAVMGHRHDESSLTWVLYRLGLRPVKRGFLTLEAEAGFIAQFAERYGIKYRGQAT